MKKQIAKKVEKAMGAKFGDLKNPLLVSVRSGARASMPGMMDTILNLGLNDKVAEGLVKKTNNPRFVYDFLVLSICGRLRRRGARLEAGAQR